MSGSNCWFLICIQVSQAAGEVVWYSHLFKNFPQFVVIHIVKGFNVVNEAEVDVFLEFSCFIYDPVDVGNSISGSSDFSKPSLYIWRFLVHILLKPSLKDFEQDGWVIVESSDKMWSTGGGNGNHSSIFAARTHEQYDKEKIFNTGRWTCQVRRCPMYYWGRVEDNY